MSVFSVPVTIGVDEEKIAKEIKAEAKEQVINKITLEVKKVLFKKGRYYGSNYDDPEPMREMVKAEIAKIVASHQDEIIKAASELLADKLSRMKVVKEAAVNVAKEV